jgi:heme oxygenase
MNPARRALRDATADAHARVDIVYAAFDLSDRASYAACLAAHAEALLPWEAALDAVAAQRVAEDWPQRKRGALLVADLAELDCPSDIGPPTSVEIERRARLLVETIDDLAAIGGALYVLEGSRFGGKFLARNLPESFPRHYLDADQHNDNWAFLLEKLDALLYASETLQAAVDAALRVFASFETAGRAWLTKDLHWPKRKNSKSI